MGSIVAGTVIARDRTRFLDKVPSSVARFLDSKTFPGKRSLVNSVKRTLFLALIADGLPASELQDPPGTPRGVDRTYAKLLSVPCHDIGTKAVATRCHVSSLVSDGKDTDGPFEWIGSKADDRHEGISFSQF